MPEKHSIFYESVLKRDISLLSNGAIDIVHDCLMEAILAAGGEVGDSCFLLNFNRAGTRNSADASGVAG